MDAASDFAKAVIDVAGGKGVVIAQPRQFKTGSRGYFGAGKVKALDGRRFQVTINVVEIGSKPNMHSQAARDFAQIVEVAQ